MSAQCWHLTLFLYPFRYILIIILVSSFCFLFNWSSVSSHHSILYFNPKNVSIRHSLTNQKSSKTHFPFTNRTVFTINNRTVRLAVVSAIYNDDYIKGVEVLGYSLRRINIQADLILFFISNRLNQSILDRCRKAGWYLWSVERIDPPRFAIIYPRFRDQYTKLKIWSMIGYDRILYLDADTLVIRDINELLTETYFENNHGGLLAAVEDVWQGQIGPNFNAGVLLIRPNKTIFDDMLIKMHNMPAYGSYWAEQGFLNWYFKGSTGRLPLIYNFNSVLPIYHQDIYSQLRDHIKIIHYTYNKPFHITQANQLSDSATTELWSIWQKMYHNMLNQSSI